MYFAMNRFKIAIGHEEAFENVWKGRDSSLAEVPGFKEFRLLRGETLADEGYTLFVSSSIWESRDAFVAWTKSDNFRAAHKALPITVRCISGRRNSKDSPSSRGLDACDFGRGLCQGFAGPALSRPAKLPRA